MVERGSGKLEFLLVVAAAGALMAAMLERMARIEEDAERTEVSLTIRNMRVGLQLAIGERIMRGEDSRLSELVDANPVNFLGHEPRGYEEAPGTATAPGSWRFDPAAGVLSYRPRQPQAFDNRPELCWRMASHRYIDGRVAGLRLESVSNLTIDLKRFCYRP